MNEFMNKEGEGQKKTGKKREREEDKKRERDEGMVGGESGGRRKARPPGLTSSPRSSLGVGEPSPLLPLAFPPNRRRALAESCPSPRCSS